MSTLLIRLEVEIPVERTVGAPALTFAHWLPIGDEYAIVVSQSDLTAKLWFDITTTYWATQPKEEELEKQRNVLAHFVFADVTVRDVTPDLLAYIRTRNYAEPVQPGAEELQRRYDDLAWRVLSLTITTLNRLLDYVRSRWGQHWLRGWQLDRGRMYSAYVHFKGKASVDGQAWFRFSPTPLSSSNIEIVPEWRYIAREDWEEVRAHVLSSRKPPLARSLLAGAESLAATGHTRSALTEAATALEVALYEFAANPRTDAALSPRLAERLGLRSLKSQVDRLGLTASVSYLLPTLLPDSILFQSTLEGCREAISLRQNVVHQGQREVSEEALRRSLRSVREMCELLERLTKDPDSFAGGEAGAPNSAAV